ncbi:MAG TPA: hypothetical protein VM490_16105 [Armatimonadaceae bacterium]|nr:hypothetical protein [Armatimonadaceae bacterium]
MDDSRKRYLAAGIVVGAVVVGVAVLARKTPRDRWAETLTRVAKDAVGVLKTRYGNSEPMQIAERAIARLEESFGA